MGLLIHLLHPLDRDVGVDLGGRQAGVTEQGLDASQIGTVVDHIVKNFKEETSVAVAAEMAAMTPATFSRNFQAVTGHGFVDFVNRVRIGQACSLLYASDDSVTTVC